MSFQLKLSYYINVCITLCFSLNYAECQDKHSGWYWIWNQKLSRVKNIKYVTAQRLCLFYLQYNPIISWQKKCMRYCTVPLVSTSAYRRTLWPVAFSVIMGPFQNWSSEAKLNSCKTLLHFAETPKLPQREMGNFTDLLWFVFNVIGRHTVFIFCILYRQNSFLIKI